MNAANRLPPSRARAFGPRSLRVLRALAGTLIPRGGAVAPGGEDLDLDATANRFFADVDPLYVHGFRAMVSAVEWLPWPFAPKWRRFTSLDESGRAAVVAAWAGSRWYWRRGVILALKSFLAMAFASHPDVERAVGYEPRCLRGEPKDPPEGDGVTGRGVDLPEGSP